MKIGVDLDATVYGFPEFFRAFIPAMHAAGHRFVCTSGHTKRQWPRDRQRLRALGIDPDLIDASLLYGKDRIPPGQGPAHKARMADRCDVVFDDDADRFQELTRTPVFKTPRSKANDR